MANRDIIVIGASAGGVEALQSIVQAFPVDWPVSVFVVVHVASSSPGYLARILGHAGTLTAKHATDGEAIQQSVIYVASPDHHLLVRRGHVHVKRGPRENGTRPAIDPLFRSAAAAYGPHVIGVLLTGMLDDGSAGLAEITRAGGLAVVQNPEEARFSTMPQNGLLAVPDAVILHLQDIPGFLVQRSRDTVPDIQPTPGLLDMETKMAGGAPVPELEELIKAHSTPLTCPDCGGTLSEIHIGSQVQYRCHVGHTYAPETLDEEQALQLEKSLWNAVRLFEERATFRRRLANEHRQRGLSASAEVYEERARESEAEANAIRRMLTNGNHSRTEEPAEEERHYWRAKERKTGKGRG